MEEVRIHPSAVVAPEARLGQGVFVGPHCVVGANVTIGDNCQLHSHVVCDGHLTIGRDNQFYPFCSIGAPPQDFSYKGEATRVEIGDGNTFREYVSVHRGTLKEGGVTSIGGGCFLMNSVHIGHDVVLGDECVFASAVLLGGHVKVGRGVFIGGGTCLQQFVRVGEGAYLGGGSVIVKDVPSHCHAYGNRAELTGINIVGLRRKSFSRQDISGARAFFQALEKSQLSPASFVESEENCTPFMDNPVVERIRRDILESKQGILPLRKEERPGWPRATTAPKGSPVAGCGGEKGGAGAGRGGESGEG